MSRSYAKCSENNHLWVAYLYMVNCKNTVNHKVRVQVGIEYWSKTNMKFKKKTYHEFVSNLSRASSAKVMYPYYTWVRLRIEGFGGYPVHGLPRMIHISTDRAFVSRYLDTWKSFSFLSAELIVFRLRLNDFRYQDLSGKRSGFR